MAVERVIVRRARKERPCSVDGYYCRGDQRIHVGELYNFRDDPELLAKAITYLKIHAARGVA